MSALLLLLSLCPAAAQPRAAAASQLHVSQPASSFPQPDKHTYPRLDSRLARIVAAVASGALPQGAAARAAPLSRGATVAVDVRLDGQPADVLAFLAAQGATLASVGRTAVEAYVPVGALA